MTLTQLSAIPITGDFQLALPEDMTQDQWADLHRSLVAVKRKAKALIVQSYDYGAKHYGDEYAGQVHEQAELALGLPQSKEKPDINGEGKAKGIVSVEGIAQSFSIWQRGVSHLIPKWDRSKIERALELLEPIEAQAKALRTRLDEL
jgi:hypothetical protein